MQVVLACVLSLAAAAVAAPYNSGMFLRRPRSHGYGGYISPCVGAGAIHAIPSYHQAPYHLGPVQGYGAQHYGGYGGPHYRADEFEDNNGEEPEVMSFSETDPAMSENAPSARYVSLGGVGGYGAAAGGYGAAAGGYGAHGLAGLSPIAPASSGAVGVFPGANVRGCSVPLLLSCSPNIVAGHLVKTHYGSHYAPAYGAGPAAIAGAGSYREDEAHPDVVQGEHSEHAEHTTTVHEAAAAAAADANKTQ